MTEVQENKPTEHSPSASEPESSKKTKTTCCCTLCGHELKKITDYPLIKILKVTPIPRQKYYANTHDVNWEVESGQIKIDQDLVKKHFSDPKNTHLITDDVVVQRISPEDSVPHELFYFRNKTDYVCELLKKCDSVIKKLNDCKDKTLTRHEFLKILKSEDVKISVDDDTTGLVKYSHRIHQTNYEFSPKTYVMNCVDEYKSRMNRRAPYNYCFLAYLELEGSLKS